MLKPYLNSPKNTRGFDMGNSSAEKKDYGDKSDVTLAIILCIGTIISLIVYYFR